MKLPTQIQIGSYAPSGIDYWNPFAYSGHVYNCNHAPSGRELRILNVIDPSNIIQVGSFDINNNIFSAYVVEDRAYLADYQNGLIVINVNNLSNPTKIAQFFDGGHAYDVEVIGNIAYVADRGEGLEIIEILI
ncbi:MAG: hypothetical protein ACFFCM_08210 [Promethearchaeota archaeon]